MQNKVLELKITEDSPLRNKALNQHMFLINPYEENPDPSVTTNAETSLTLLIIKPRSAITFQIITAYYLSKPYHQLSYLRGRHRFFPSLRWRPENKSS
jgi:hypothetical protein